MRPASVVLTAAVLAAGALATQSAHAGLTLSLARRVAVTTDGEGGSARPEIVATADRVFVLYLGDIADGTSRTFRVKIFDRTLDSLIASRTIVPTTAEYGSPTDIRVASDGHHVYAFYETHKIASPSTGVTYLWGAKYALDDSLSRVAYTTTPITSSMPMSQLPEGGELLDDPAPLIGPDSVYVVTRLKYSLSMVGRTAYRVRGFRKDTLAQVSEFDLDLSGAANGRGRVSSLLFCDNRIYMALATTVSDEGINDGIDDGAMSDLVLVRMQPDWAFDPRRDVITVSAEAGDRENYASGLRTDGDNFYLTYKEAVGIPPSGEQIAWIKIFDRDFNLRHAEKVKSTPWGPLGGEIRPSLEVTGHTVLSGQSGGQGLGTGNAEVYVYETAGLDGLRLRVNNDPCSSVAVTDPVTVEYTIRGGQGRELFLALEGQPVGLPWSHLNAAGQWIPWPANPAAVTPFMSGPSDGDHLLYTGPVPAGRYTICLGYDMIPNGRLDLEAAVHDCVTATVH